MTLEEALELLKDGMYSHHPHAAIILAAKFAINEYDRELLPDWVAALANASVSNWREAEWEVFDMLRAYEASHDN